MPFRSRCCFLSYWVSAPPLSWSSSAVGRWRASVQSKLGTKLTNTTIAGRQTGTRAATHAKSGQPPARRLIGIGRHVLFVLICIVILFPIAYMLLASFKSVKDFFAHPYGLPSVWQWQNYTNAWEQANVAITLTNSVIVTTVSVLISTT